MRLVSRLETLSPQSTPEALAYLARSPFENVYVQWLIESRQIGRSGDVLLHRGPRRAVTGLCYAGLQIVPYADDLATYEAFAGPARRTRGLRQIVGPRPGVERFWQKARRFMPKPSAIRTSQPVYAIDRRTLRYSRADAATDRATPDELDEVAANSALMIAGELGDAAHSTSAELRARTARIIAAGWWWRYRVNGELAFSCNVGSATAKTAQLQGVWTPPELRGSGHATRALGAICDRLLDEYPSLTLYVNDFNTPAIALYERVGFVRVGEFQTILFAS